MLDAKPITSPAAEFGRIECLRHQWLGGYLLMPRVPVVTGNSVRLAPRPVAAVQPVQLDNAIAEGVQHFGARSEERRVGQECVCTCRSRWWPYYYKKK